MFAAVATPQQTHLATVKITKVKAYKPGQSRQQRGYGTKWEVIRERILKRDKGLCQNHLRQAIVKQASCVDHIKAKAHGGTDEDSNLESLCWSCHAAKTARERLK